MEPNRLRPFYSLMAGNILIVIIVFAVAATVAYRSLDAEYLRETEAHQHQLAVMARLLVERTWPQPEEEIDRLCDRLATETSALASEAGTGRHRALPVRVTVVASDGRVLGDSQGNPAEMSNHRTPDRPEIMSALEGKTGNDSRRSETLGAPYRYIALPVSQGGQVVAAVRIALPIVAISEAETVIQQTILWMTITAIVVFGLVGLLVNWTWYRSQGGRIKANPAQE